MDIRKLQEVNMSKKKPCLGKLRAHDEKNGHKEEKAGNISKIKGNQKTSDRVYERNWT